MISSWPVCYNCRNYNLSKRLCTIKKKQKVETSTCSVYKRKTYDRKDTK